MDFFKEKDSSRNDFLKETLQLILIVVIVLIPFRMYVAQPFMVDGSSMDPTFRDGQYLIVDEVSYRFNDPERGDVIVLKDVSSSELGLMARMFKRLKGEYYAPVRYLIKRVIGLPGEEVRLNDGVVTIFNEQNKDGLVLEEPYIQYAQGSTGTYKLGENEYFVMGDNRANSSDSRIWGPVPKDHIVGRPFVRFAPPALFPGDLENYNQK